MCLLLQDLLQSCSRGGDHLPEAGNIYIGIHPSIPPPTNEYLARFKHSATGDAIDELEAYKTWTQKQKAKAAAGFTHTTTAPRSAPGSAPGSAQKASPFVVDSD